MEANQELADFLRSRRSRLRPDGIALAAHRRRRTPGLRREDVAQRAGISVEWYVKLEQGRAVSPSDETLDALGRALELDAVEQAHLRSLVRKAKGPPFTREVVPASIRRLVESLSQPAYVTGQRWDILAWNAAAVELFDDFAQISVKSRNILLFVLTDPKARRLFGTGWAKEAKRMVSLFRVAHDLWAGDAAFAALVERLRTGCPEFDSWWRPHDVGAPLSGAKILYHPVRGPLQFEYATFQANDDPRLKLAIYLER
ncbi:Xre family transcriptional regulator [Rhizobium sp. ERR 922]|uniref:helix-turn-helix transcriptional regulator n=1 Tax=unclassified Rhizobium TaxID=2613769 RepID=UPI0011A65EC1|nr:MULTISPECIES: helix-turn-helix transcriptional regulator [unclassified Rhizobium]TWB45044.1 Xre family transcriptional regulator [Rhizobium sp. ERR 922]TWB87922.1 Xre family transcriptional regulator [Rhizobium sp. ERR 942]